MQSSPEDVKKTRQERRTQTWTQFPGIKEVRAQGRCAHMMLTGLQGLAGTERL